MGFIFIWWPAKYKVDKMSIKNGNIKILIALV